MDSTSLRSAILVLALALPFKATGCGGRTACFTVTAAQVPGGACPDPGTAAARLVNAPCPGSVASVDGPGALDGNLCCYPVTYQDNSNNFGEPFGGGSVCVGNTTFPGDTSTGTGVVTGFGGFGVGGGTTTACVSCNTALQGAPFNQVCDKTILSNLRVCACASNCTGACDPTMCNGNAPDNACLSCMEGACGAQLMACQQN